MEETKDPNASKGGQDEGQGTTGTPKRDEEATSSETLSDIEENTKVKGESGSGSESSGSLEGSTPSPDAGGGGGGRADGSDTGGPM
ncbi:MAG TPA: hypothetical protein VFS10_13895 [Pyrinomonadaceae bacterium]|nr:hypothetical protein [Pyrinomonadaceae bacterium]